MSDIHKSVDRMISLINFLLQIARIETGRVKIEPRPLDLVATTQEVVASLSAALAEKPHTVTVGSIPEVLPKIPMDKDVLWQVIQNLLTNAIRYSEAGSTITVSLSQVDGFIQCSVKDQGIGIPKDQQARVFEKFYRAPNAFKLVPEGTGLGLSLVKSLVTDWGGQVWFETEEGKGTTFYFTIPQAGMKPREGEVTLAV
jgi:two-component system sensor histidine kinase VicK